MKIVKAGLFVVVVVCAIDFNPPLFAQSRAEAGIFVDYLGVSQTNTNNFGLGGRFGYCVHEKVIIEGWVRWACALISTAQASYLLVPHADGTLVVKADMDFPAHNQPTC